MSRCSLAVEHVKLGRENDPVCLYPAPGQTWKVSRWACRVRLTPTKRTSAAVRVAPHPDIRQTKTPAHRPGICFDHERRGYGNPPREGEASVRVGFWSSLESDLTMLAELGPRPGCGPTRPEGRGRACSPRAARRDSFGLAQRVVNLHQGAAPRRVRVRGAENFFEVGRSVPVLFMLTRSRLVRRIALKRQEKRRIGPHS